MNSKLKLDFEIKKYDIRNTEDAKYAGKDDLLVYNMLILSLRVDDLILIKRTIDLTALHLSYLAEKTSNHYIFTCSCGNPGCAGVYEEIKIKKNINEIIWMFNKEK